MINKFQEEKQGSLNWHGLEKELYEKKKKQWEKTLEILQRILEAMPWSLKFIDFVIGSLKFLTPGVTWPNAFKEAHSGHSGHRADGKLEKTGNGGEEAGCMWLKYSHFTED